MKTEGYVVSYNNSMRGITFNEIEKRVGKVNIISEGTNSSVITSSDQEDMADKLIRNKLIFARHIHPYSIEVELTGASNDLMVLEEQCHHLLPELQGDAIYCCQCRIDSSIPYEFGNSELTQHIANFFLGKEIQINVERAWMAISLSIVDKKAYLGVSSLDDNLSKWAGGVLFYAKDDSVISRAEFKIEEAVEFFKIRLDDVSNAIDLGAAPGGWSHYLATQGIQVDAVDPAALSEKLQDEKNISHYKMTAQEFSRKYVNKKYDLIVNDMKMDSIPSTQIVCELAKHLRSNGQIILTLKLPKNGVWKKINKSVSLLEESFTDIRVRQLYYNRSEVTIYARKR
jgi:23S rRNA (cytidine2498-2'-O)-methyltransferase